MRHPDTTYTGERLTDRGRILGVRVEVNGRELSPARSLKVTEHSPTGFEWGYCGSGPSQLALALLLDCTGSKLTAKCAYQWFKRAVVADWGERWRITAGEIARWLDQWEREAEACYVPVAVGCVAVRRCRACGCTDDDCRQCVAATGRPCSWVEAEEPPICTRCADAEDVALLREMEAEGGAL